MKNALRGLPKKVYNLHKHTSFNFRILETIWNDEAGEWKITIDVDGAAKEDEADILVKGRISLSRLQKCANLPAILIVPSKWKMPNIPGLAGFKGKPGHSASATWYVYDPL